jgi:hypothetical protein
MRAKAWRLENSAALRPKAHPTHAPAAHGQKILNTNRRAFLFTPPRLF